RDLDRRLADLERRLGRRALALLGDEDAGLRTCLLELNPESQPRQAAAQDRHVVAVCGLPIPHVALLFPVSGSSLLAVRYYACAATTAPRFSRSISSIPGSASSASVRLMPSSE